MLTFKLKNLPKPIAINLKALKLLNGDIAIMDHEEIDIVLGNSEEGKYKVTALPKKEITDEVYAAQDRLLKFLVNRGVLDASTIRGGNVYGAMEGEVFAPPTYMDIDPIEATLFVVSRFINQEREGFQVSRDWKQAVEDRWTDPDEDETTELGDVPHKVKKGQLDPNWPPYRQFYGYYFEE